MWRRSRWVANEHFAPAALVVIADAGRPSIGDGLRRSDRPPSLNRNTRWSQSPRFWLGPTGRGRGDAAVLASFSIGTVTACGARGQMNVPLPQPGRELSRQMNRLCSARPRRQRPVPGRQLLVGSSFAGDANVVDASGGGVVSGHDLWSAAWTNPGKSTHCGRHRIHESHPARRQHRSCQASTGPATTNTYRRFSCPNRTRFGRPTGRVRRLRSGFGPPARRVKAMSTSRVS